MRARCPFIVVSTLLACGCDTRTVPPGAQPGELRVFVDRYEYAGESYPSLAGLESALSARPVERVHVTVSTCADTARVEDVLQFLGDRAGSLLATFEERC